jgi:hypothetical protein
MQTLGTKDDAMARFKETHPEAVIRPAMKPSTFGLAPVKQEGEKPVIIVNAKPETYPKPGPKPKITDEEKEKIRQRYKNAKQGIARLPGGWAKHMAKEYNVSESLIWNIVYTADDYVVVPRK